MPRLNQFFRQSFFYVLMCLLLAGTFFGLVHADINTATEHLQGRNKSSITDEIRKQISANDESGDEESDKDESTETKRPEPVLGINTADVREDTSSVQFLDLFKSSIPFQETVPWGSSKGLEYDEYGWPSDLKGGQAGTKFLNRLPQDTVEDGFFTVLYDGEGEIFYGNDARLIVHRPNKDIIEIKAGTDKILNASLFIKKSNPENYIRNIRILPEGGICKDSPHIRVKTDLDCEKGEYLSFEDNHLNPLADEQLKLRLKDQTSETSSDDSDDVASDVASDSEINDDNDSKNTASSDKLKAENTKEKESEKSKKVSNKEATKDTKKITENEDRNKPQSNKNNKNIKYEIKGYSDVSKAIVFNPDYLNFMKDFQVIRYMNMSGMTRNPVTDWKARNTLKKASWGGKYGSRGAPVEVMVALSNQIKADPWFSMPFKASDDYIKAFGEYVNEHLNKELKAYIEYSNEVWNPIFSHHDYAIAEGMKQKLDEKKSIAGYKWYSLRSVKTFKIWEEVFGGNDRLVRVLGSWASNQTMSSTILSYKDAYKHTDAVAIGPYFSAHPRVLRRAKTVDDVFKAMLDKTTKWGMDSTINYIKKQANVAKSFGVDLVAYEGGQHLVDWNTRKVDEHPNKLLYAANRDPRMGILYDELMEGWQRNGGKLFVAFSAPRIYSWYGSWGLKEHIRQPRSEAPKYDSLIRYLNARLYPEEQTENSANSGMALLNGESADTPVIYAKTPNDIWALNAAHAIKSHIKDNSSRDISASWQASWDTKHLYISLAVNDDDLQNGDSVSLTLDTTTEEQIKAKKIAQEKIDIKTEKKLLAKKKEEQAARKKVYEARAKAQAEKAKKKEKENKKEADKEKDKDNEIEESSDSSKKKSVSVTAEETNDKTTIEKDKENLSEKVKNDDKASIKDVTKTIEKELKKSLKKSRESNKESNKDEVLTSKNKAETKSDNESNTETSTETNTEKNKSNAKSSENKTAKQELMTISDEAKKAKSKDTAKDDSDDGAKEDAKENAKEKTKDSTEKPAEIANNDANQDESNKDQSATEDDLEAKVNTDQSKTVDVAETQVTPKISITENAITFTFTPFDEATTKARTIRTDAGYLLNLAIPWKQIYAKPAIDDPDSEDDAATKNKEDTDKSVVDNYQPKPGDKLGINIVISDVDTGEKGGKELRSADTNLPLPKLILKNSLTD
ncbi:hypothetical protein OO007_08205 [Cocleimonas sp. KMM 6892]|uniref:hypothetical protein n=1 Tax=unclassified Cocleimonas TaxID=2639732 RepID=UPI002DBAC50B|nr:MULTISPECIES: hypothetical protein [unclassified Cocleimonas]MEB8432208.1 hypothetical protein [Cocleimonas sp. KMM 6892]MEC4714706.1 hypothetical protein [Cocleimonas sp. KMM 6895]MEC4744480.1 hypothetical protein [Cocleimonas sp. KMM 6896]